MTVIRNVEAALLMVFEYKQASYWIQNDIIKINLAKGYDDWMQDVHDHKMPLTLKEYIVFQLDTREDLELENAHSD